MLPHVAHTSYDPRDFPSDEVVSRRNLLMLTVSWQRADGEGDSYTAPFELDHRAGHESVTDMAMLMEMEHGLRCQVAVRHQAFGMTVLTVVAQLHDDLEMQEPVATYTLGNYFEAQGSQTAVETLRSAAQPMLLQIAGARMTALLKQLGN